MKTTLVFALCLAASSAFLVERTSILKFESGNSRYVAVNRPVLTWQAANSYCQQHYSMQLATIQSAQENSLIRSKLRSLEGIFPDPEGWWIGVSDSKREANFVNQCGQPQKFTDWMLGQPDNSRLKQWVDGEDCVEVFTTSLGGSWRDEECSDQQPFVCETSTACQKPTTDAPTCKDRDVWCFLMGTGDLRSTVCTTSRARDRCAKWCGQCPESALSTRIHLPQTDGPTKKPSETRQTSIPSTAFPIGSTSDETVISLSSTKLATKPPAFTTDAFFPTSNSKPKPSTKTTFQPKSLKPSLSTVWWKPTSDNLQTATPTPSSGSTTQNVTAASTSISRTEQPKKTLGDKQTTTSGPLPLTSHSKVTTASEQSTVFATVSKPAWSAKPKPTATPEGKPAFTTTHKYPVTSGNKLSSTPKPIRNTSKLASPAPASTDFASTLPGCRNLLADDQCIEARANLGCGPDMMVYCRKTCDAC